MLHVIQMTGKTGRETIGDEAFEDCIKLTSVSIPNSVTSIGDGAFFGCTGLTSIHADSDNPEYSSENGVLFNKNKTALVSYPGGKTGGYIIPRSVTTVSDYTFANCSGLTSVTIPNSVTTVGDCAFWLCIGLTSVSIPNSVTAIDRFAFANCRGLTSVTIPNSVTRIGDEAFCQLPRLDFHPCRFR
ncbi:MAG: leucine-rich repeat domain-containing protein [Bacteroidales bacterium]|nr:leucine-rich repeat domain-containing protein [Bacteroidales bacterium]